MMESRFCSRSRRCKGTSNVVLLLHSPIEQFIHAGPFSSKYSRLGAPADPTLLDIVLQHSAALLGVMVRIAHDPL